MFERFTTDAREAVAHAQDSARRLGHPFIGGEHIMLALVSGDSPAGAALREHGLTPQQVEDQIVRLTSPGPTAARRADLDRDALAAIGIDLDQVSAALDATFGSGALSRAAAYATGRRPQRGRCANRRALRHPWRRWRTRQRSARRRTARTAGAPFGSPATRPYRSGSAGHLPFTARAKKILELSLRESHARHDNYIGAQHLALALVASNDDIIARIVSALGTSPAALTAAINDRYREAS
jgi:ATP-dependent Clp protease ATP-binding subunit ClpA